MHLLFQLIVLSLVFVSATVLSNPQYRWKDENGQIHYGQTKPTEYEYTEVNAPPPPPAYSPDINKPFENEIRKSGVTKTPSQAQQASDAKDRKKIAKQCQKLKDNLILLKTGRRIKVHDPDGNVSIVTEEQRQTKITNAEKQIADYCQ